MNPSLLEDSLGQLPVLGRLLELVRESEVVELPRVGGEVEDVVLGALAEPAVARGEHPLQGDGLAVLEGGADHVPAQGDCGPRGT